jgi:TetR/AcrR family transcriptional repressor of nem operon
MAKCGETHPTRERILKAATDLMWRQGYRRTSPAQVMKLAEVGQGSFYHHFPDKRSLGLAVVERLVEATTESLAEIFRSDQPPIDRIRSWTRCFHRQYRPPCDRGCPLGKLGYEMAGEDEAFREALAYGFAAIRAALTEALQDAARRGQLHPVVDPAGVADLLLAGMEGTILLAQCDGEPAKMDRSLAQLDRLLDLCDGRAP